jgi:hypothetical protein
MKSIQGLRKTKFKNDCAKNTAAMKANLITLVFTLFCCIPAFAQRNCGQQAMFRHLESLHPGTLQQIEALKENAFLRLSESKAMDKTLLKTTEEIIIPVVFHIVLDSSQVGTLGGIDGIESRINTQMKVINDDFNGRNADKSKVPSVWAPLFADMAVSFGLAHVSPSGTYTPGYDIRYAAKGTSFDAENGAKAAKFSVSGGTDAWDNSKYLNIWILNLKITGSTALGITAPPGFPEFTKPELGIALNYLSFGSRVNPSQVFIKNFELGRTLTHELGHYFYLWHTWGDDNGTCAKDDGFSDTPLQGDNSTGTPTFPRLDACTPSGNGIMFMNYMDYTDDISLYMFTLQQAAMVRSQLSPGGLSYTLTQNKHLVDTQYKPSAKILIGPNPARDYLYLIYDAGFNPLERVIVMNMWGQKVIETTEQGITRIDLQSFAKGIYFVHCYFKNEIVKQKISLQ